MNNLTKTVLKRPVSTLLIVLALIFFGVMSYMGFKLELTPEISMPMYLVMTVYPGAAPEDVDENVTKKMEAQLANLSDVKEMDSMSSENMSMVILQYEYGTNMEQAYDDLKKKVDQIGNSLDDAVQDPYIMEMDVNAMPSMTLIVNNTEAQDMYNYVANTFQPELEKLSSVAQVASMGGSRNYISICVKPEELKKYGLSMSNISQLVANADFSIPGGSVKDASQDLSVSTAIEYKTVEALKNIPITTGSRDIIYLEDIADISFKKAEKDSIGRYDGKDTMVVSLTKNQASTAVEMSKDVYRVIDKMKAQDSALEVTVVNDSRDMIESSLNNVLQTMIMAVILSMIIIYLFLGDIKASLIIGTSIPISLLIAIIAMHMSGFSLNMVTLSSLVLGVGMMVDNSIVILEGCFRSKDKFRGNDVEDYVKAALDSVKTLGGSVFGSTLTTCVVFGPLATIQGMVGQFFRPLGLTIVYCMAASLISAISIVPLCFVFLRPIERKKSPLSGMVLYIQRAYRNFVPKLLAKRKKVLIVFLVFVALAFFMATRLGTELIPSTDEGMVAISLQTKPSVRLEYKEELTNIVEDFVAQDPNVEDYMVSASAGDNVSVTAYLKDNRKMTTDEVVSQWKKDLSVLTDCTLDVSASSSMGIGNMSADDNTFSVVIESNDYDKLKEVNDTIVDSMVKRGDLVGIHSSLENSASLIKVMIDPVLASADGFQPALIGSEVRNAITGVDVMDMIIDGDTYEVDLEYPSDEYDTLEKIENLSITSMTGVSSSLKDIANISYQDSPKTIQKKDKNYQSTIKASFSKSENATKIKQEIMQNNVRPYLTTSVQTTMSSYDQTLNEELGSLFSAIIVSIFLVFLVMAMQFENVRYSFMIMFTILFAFAGAFFMLWVSDNKISMVALLGFMMLIGTAVNNGILYVDSVNDMKGRMPVEQAVVETGALRYRPMLMTTLTTIVAMIPMALGYGDSGELMSSLGIVNIGGLIVSTICALYLLPELYIMMSRKKVSAYADMSKKVNNVTHQLDIMYQKEEMKELKMLKIQQEEEKS